MQTYLIRRILLLIPTMFIVSVVAFSLVRLMPGDVVVAQLSESPFFRPEDADALRDQLGLNDSWPEQYGRWVGGVLTGDLGTSLWSSRGVAGIIGDRMFVTIELALMAFVIANIIAVTFGVLSAIRQDSWIDYVVRLLSIGGLSVPNFWVGTLVIVLGAKYLNYLPPLVHIKFTEDPIGNIEQFIVPAMVIATGASATIMRLVRSSMLEVLRQDYIRTAWAKGLHERRIIYRHALRNAILPVVTLQGYQLGVLLSGSVIVEIVFGLPGLGRLAFDAVNQRDYTVLQGLILLFATVFVTINFLIDLTYAWIDPRVKYGGNH